MKLKFREDVLLTETRGASMQSILEAEVGLPFSLPSRLDGSVVRCVLESDSSGRSLWKVQGGGDTQDPSVAPVAREVLVRVIPKEDAGRIRVPAAGPPPPLLQPAWATGAAYTTSTTTAPATMNSDGGGGNGHAGYYYDDAGYVIDGDHPDGAASAGTACPPSMLLGGRLDALLRTVRPVPLPLEQRG